MGGLFNALFLVGAGVGAWVGDGVRIGVGAWVGDEVGTCVSCAFGLVARWGHELVMKLGPESGVLSDLPSTSYHHPSREPCSACPRSAAWQEGSWLWRVTGG